jgi:hypothetical protein
MQKEQLAQAGFFRSEWVPSDTRYLHGELYVRMTERGSLRLFFPAGSSAVELSSGSLYEPIIHYLGSLQGVAAALALLEGSFL